MRRLFYPASLAPAMIVSAAPSVAPQPMNAGPSSDKPAARAPVDVPGFRLQHLPPRTYVNTCTEPVCGPGAKVSYILFAADPTPDFELFKVTRAKLQRTLEQRLPMGAKLSFEAPLQMRETTFTLFEHRRTETLLDGRSSTVITRQLYTRRFSVELVSSSSDPKTAAANAALFQTSLVLAGQR